MSEPHFLVPLSTMIHTYEMGDRLVWSCLLAVQYRDDAPTCRADSRPLPRDEAVSAAVQHLADAHSLVPARPAPDTEAPRAIERQRDAAAARIKSLYRQGSQGTPEYEVAAEWYAELETRISRSLDTEVPSEQSLPEAEEKVRTFLKHHGDDNVERVMVELDRLRTALAARDVELAESKAEVERLTGSVGCEHLDGPYRKLLAERDQLKAARARALALCDEASRSKELPTLSTGEVRRALGWTGGGSGE